jgi:hypothetical protein
VTQTRREVVGLAQRVGHDQFPAYYDQISGDVYLAGLPTAPAQSSTPRTSPQDEAARVGP